MSQFHDAIVRVTQITLFQDIKKYTITPLARLLFRQERPDAREGVVTNPTLDNRLKVVSLIVGMFTICMFFILNLVGNARRIVYYTIINLKFD